MNLSTLARGRPISAYNRSSESFFCDPAGNREKAISCLPGSRRKLKTGCQSASRIPGRHRNAPIRGKSSDAHDNSALPGERRKCGIAHIGHAHRFDRLARDSALSRGAAVVDAGIHAARDDNARLPQEGRDFIGTSAMPLVQNCFPWYLSEAGR